MGAGTGSVSVEMARMAVDGMVYAVEKKEEAAALIEKNREAFGICNLQVIRGCAPEALKSLPAPTHVFIGGSSGNLREIMELVLEKNPGARMVINCITLETMAEALQCIRQLPVEDVDIAQITAAKGKTAGPYHLMMGQNPVTVISCTGSREEEKQS
ncbi:MAG: precorrin-6Y C5,15-methyltransferase (decarboxylating) subunit CbiT [Lachnospiraceae bacterium]